MAPATAKQWWDGWAPFWEPLEDRHFGLAAIERAVRFVASPVLVVGAGQGLIVERLRARGFEVEGLDASEQMIAAARARRGLELRLGDAASLPWEDGHFRTVVVASGVLDYQPDEEACATMIREALRVLRPWGSLLAGFYRFAPRLERVYRRIGVIVGGEHFARRLFELGEVARVSPFRCVPLITSWTGRGTIATALHWANAGLLLHDVFRREAAAVEAVFRRASAAGLERRTLLERVPERIPYRGEAELRTLFAGAGVPWIDVTAMDDCLVVRHQQAGPPARLRRAAAGETDAETPPRDGRPATEAGSVRAAGSQPWHIRTEQICKRYRGSTRDAVHALDLSIEGGRVFGLLGPNGAGKTTTLMMLCGLLQPDSGTIRFSGDRDAAAVRSRIGLVPQNLAIFPQLSARENLDFFGRLHGLRGRALRARTDELLERIGLSDRADDRSDAYSGGMKRRLNLVTGLVHEPEILLLDEPTVGMDPQSRNRVFEMVGELKQRGVTVLYTTHYMDEASRLCDRVAIMDHGSILVEGWPDELIDRIGSCRVELEVDSYPAPFAAELGALGGVADARESAGIVTITTTDATSAVAVVDGALDLARRHRVAAVLRTVAASSLENVFLNLTGRSLRDESE